MRLERLVVSQLRLFERAEIEPGAGINVFIGPNGAGKTTLLEAIHLLAAGRSFRSNQREALTRAGAEQLSVHARLVREPHGQRHSLGLARDARGWKARLDGDDLPRLSQLHKALAVVCFAPGSHELVSGASEHRRRYLDWALFHVEQAFLPAWRAYQRALKQRNRLLKLAAGAAELAAWESELARNGAVIHQQRLAWLDALKPWVAQAAGRVLPDQGELELTYQAGWTGDKDAQGLMAALQASRQRDQQVGHTRVGPHRADWRLGFARLPQREMFSRGQEKLVVLACLMAQAQAFAARRGEWPILLFDDLASELDARHLDLALRWLVGVPAQAFITGTAMPGIEVGSDRGLHLFHVEQGRVGARV